MSRNEKFLSQKFTAETEVLYPCNDKILGGGTGENFIYTDDLEF